MRQRVWVQLQFDSDGVDDLVAVDIMCRPLRTRAERDSCVDVGQGRSACVGKIGLVITVVDLGQTVTVGSAATRCTVDVGATQLELKGAGAMGSLASGQAELPRGSADADA